MTTFHSFASCSYPSVTGTGSGRSMPSTSMVSRRCSPASIGFASKTTSDSTTLTTFAHCPFCSSTTLSCTNPPCLHNINAHMQMVSCRRNVWGTPGTSTGTMVGDDGRGARFIPSLQAYDLRVVTRDSEHQFRVIILALE